MVRRSAVLSSARTFRARDPWPAGVRGRRHSHARIHDRGASRKFDTVPRRRVAEEMLLSSAREKKKRAFLSVLVYEHPRVYTTPTIYYHVTRELGGGRAASRVLSRSVSDRVHTRHSAVWRRRWWLLQEFPVDRYLREGITAVWRGAQAARREGVVVRTRIFCLVHGSSETRSRCSTRRRLWKAFPVIESVSLTLYLHIEKFGNRANKMFIFFKPKISFDLSYCNFKYFIITFDLFNKTVY